jgi:hypothetical protein
MIPVVAARNNLKQLPVLPDAWRPGLAPNGLTA